MRGYRDFGQGSRNTGSLPVLAAKTFWATRFALVASPRRYYVGDFLMTIYLKLTDNEIYNKVLGLTGEERALKMNEVRPRSFL